jgi:hypothetical protein
MSHSARKRQRHNVMRRKSLHIAIHFKPQYRLRAPQVSALQHAAVFQFQRIGKSSAGEH